MRTYRWDGVYRYELVGGGVFCVAPTDQTKGLGPPGNRDDPIFNTPRRVFITEFVPEIITKSDDALQWHEGTLTKDASSRIKLYVPPGLCVWDVSDAYRKVAMSIITDICTRTNDTFFTLNPNHWGSDYDERGFIRMSEIRCGFPSIPMPGLCVQECGSNHIDTESYDTIVCIACMLTQFNEKEFNKRVAKDWKSDLVFLNAMEAMMCAVLCITAMIGGYDTEKIDDTSVPWQKRWTNCDCEDFAISAVGLYTHMKEGHLHESKTPLGRFLARYVTSCYCECKLATGFVHPGVSRPDEPFSPDGLGGHAFVVMRRQNSFLSHLPTRWVVVECTALTLSYFLPSKDFGSIITIDDVCAPMKVKTSCGKASLHCMTKEMVPFRYKSIATISDQYIEEAVTTDGKAVGVDVEDFMRDKIRRVPVFSAPMKTLYDKYLRKFAMNPPDVCALFRDVPQNKDRLLSFEKDENPVFHACLYTANDINRGNRGLPPPGMLHKTFHTVFGDLLVAGYGIEQETKEGDAGVLRLGGRVGVRVVRNLSSFQRMNPGKSPMFPV